VIGVLAAMSLVVFSIMTRAAVKRLIEVVDRLIHRHARRREPSIPGA
jgi:hypothetical protein